MQNLSLIFCLFSKINTEVVNIVMDSDSDMSEINDSDLSILSNYFERDSHSTSESTGEGDSDDDENGVHLSSFSQQPGHRQIHEKRDYIRQAAKWQLPFFTVDRIQGPTAKAAIKDENNPYNYFKLFFTNRFLEALVSETNHYACQYLIITTLTPHTRAC